MRITDKKLRQIIREELSRVDEAFGMDPLGRMAARAAKSWGDKGGGIDIQHGRGPKMEPVMSSAGKKQPEIRSSQPIGIPKKELGDTPYDRAKQDWDNGGWLDAYSSGISESRTSVVLAAAKQAEADMSKPYGGWPENIEWSGEDGALREFLESGLKGIKLSPEEIELVVTRWPERDNFPDEETWYETYEPSDY